MIAVQAITVNSLSVVALIGFALPSFDGEAALAVGAIVAVATVVVLVVAIATPFVAMAGGSVLATAAAIAGIAAITGAIAGAASGFYWGNEGDLKRAGRVAEVAQLSNRLDICFVPKEADEDRAVDFCCRIITRDEVVDASGLPAVEENVRDVKAANGDEFYRIIDRELGHWFAKRVSGDDSNLSRIVTVYMQPNPGEGAWDRLETMVRDLGGVPTKTEGRRPGLVASSSP